MAIEITVIELIYIHLHGTFLRQPLHQSDSAFMLDLFSLGTCLGLMLFTVSIEVEVRCTDCVQYQSWQVPACTR